MATRQERMRDRMRGAGRHNVGDIDFDFIIPVAEEPVDEAEDSPVAEPSPPSPTPATRPTPNTSVKRKHLDRDASRLSPSSQSTATAPAPIVHPPPPSHDVYSIPDHSTEAGETTTHAPPSTLLDQEDKDEDHPMTDAPPPPQRGPLSSVISATKRLSFDPSSSSPPTTRSHTRLQNQQQQQSQQQEIPMEMEVTESPADAPGSGRRRPLRLGAGTPVVGSSTLLQKVLDDLDEGDESVGVERGGHGSSPIERRVATRRARRSAEAVGSVGSGKSVGSRRSPRLSESSIAESEVGDAGGEGRLGVVEEEDRVVEELVEEIEESTVQIDGDEEVDEVETAEEEEEEQNEAQEVGEKEAAQRLGRKRPRRSMPAPSPELGSGVTEESPAPKRRRRREAASPAQQQQPAKKARVGRPPAKPQSQPARQPSPSPPPPPRRQAESQAKPKPKSKQQPKKKKKHTDDEDTEGPTGSVPVAVQRFTKPPRAAAGDDDDEPDTDILNSDIPFTNRGGVNAVDVLSTLCEELVEAYMGKLEERARAAEDAATRREQKTMYRALEAFQEELRTRLLEHTIALDTLHALRKRVRAAQKEKLSLRDEILRVRAEREQVALRMDAIRIRHEADSKEALRNISLSSAMHDIDLAVEKGQAAPELSPAEQTKADLANLELLVSRVADQACTRSDGGGALRQIREFNAFLERTAAVLEKR